MKKSEFIDSPYPVMILSVVCASILERDYGASLTIAALGGPLVALVIYLVLYVVFTVAACIFRGTEL